MFDEFALSKPRAEGKPPVGAKYMRKRTSKLKKQESRALFVVFVLAAMLNQLLVSAISQAMAQDSALADSADVYAASVAGPSLIEIPNLENDDSLAIQNGGFLKPTCLTANGCGEKEVEQVKEALVQKKINKVTVTAYSSTADQTDSSPFITANGTYVHDGIVATNFLPFGTKVKFPEAYGDKVFIVEDRMAKKNSHKMDIWMPSRSSALEFGVKSLAFEIVE